MDFYDFLRQFVAGDVLSVAAVAALVGGAAWAIVEAFDRLVKRGNKLGEGLPSNVKYWGTVGLCFVIPYAAYILVTTNDRRPVTFGAVAIATGVAFFAATTLHWVTGGSKKAAENKRIWRMRKQGKTIPPLPSPPPQSQP